MARQTFVTIINDIYDMARYMMADCDRNTDLKCMGLHTEVICHDRISIYLGDSNLTMFDNMSMAQLYNFLLLIIPYAVPHYKGQSSLVHAVNTCLMNMPRD
jgi:hypothetical protein